MARSFLFFISIIIIIIIIIIILEIRSIVVSLLTFARKLLRNGKD